MEPADRRPATEHPRQAPGGSAEEQAKHTGAAGAPAAEPKRPGSGGSGFGAAAEARHEPDQTDPLDEPDPDLALEGHHPVAAPQLTGDERVHTGMSTTAWSPSVAELGHAEGLAPEEVQAAFPTAAPGDTSDAAIMLRVRDGDNAAFSYLVEKYQRAMVHFMYRMVHNQAVAEELAQEVFLRVYRSRESYRAEAKFTTWLYRIATNLGVNYARDHRHERAAQSVYLDEPDEETGSSPDLADTRQTAEQELLKDERMRAIRQHVMALPERQRNAVLMHKYQEMDYKQIGQVLKLSESATKSLLFRAYQTLRERLKEYV